MYKIKRRKLVKKTNWRKLVVNEVASWHENWRIFCRDQINILRVLAFSSAETLALLQAVVSSSGSNIVKAKAREYRCISTSRNWIYLHFKVWNLELLLVKLGPSFSSRISDPKPSRSTMLAPCIISIFFFVNSFSLAFLYF